MRYRLFLYAAAPKSDMIVSGINRMIEDAFQHKNYDSCCLDHLASHDFTAVCKEFEGIGRCVCGFPLDNVLCIAANENTAEKAISTALMAAVRDELVMYDPQTHKYFYNHYRDKGLIAMKTRGEELRQMLFRAVKPVWSIWRIMSDDRYKETAFAVTLSYRPNTTIEERLWEFYNALAQNLIKGEKLEVGDGCYKVVSEEYTIIFSVEGYKKHIFWKGALCRQEGLPLKTEIMPVGRMGADMAYRIAESFDKGEEKDDFESRMYFTEMEFMYPNPTDRYAASVNFTKRQRRLPFDVRYSGCGYYSSEILFFVYDNSIDARSCSVLKIEEESASYILPFIYDICPYLNERYYAETYLPVQIWNNVIDHLKNVKKLILHDNANELITSHMDKFNLFVLAKDDKLRKMVSADPAGLVYLKRYEIAELFDILIKWSEAQEYHFGFHDDGIICVKGP